MNLKKFLNPINKKTSYFFFYLLIFSYAIFYVFKLGITSDAGFYVLLGQIRLDYLLSLGQIKVNSTINQDAFPAIYLFFVALISDFFPKKLEIQIFYVLNYISSFVAAIGVYKLSKLLFNKQIGIYTFVFFLFYAAFFGHMLINGRDTTILLCNVWITYFTIKYLNFNLKKNEKYVIYLSIITAIGLGVRFHFIATLVPLLSYVFYKVFLTSKNYKIIFFKDFFKIILFSSLIIFIFWGPVHSNFLLKIQEIYNFTAHYGWGVPYNIINGNIFASRDYPLNYTLEFLFYKSPEYIIFLYISFFLLLKPLIKKIKIEIPEFNEKIIFILINIFYPTFLLLLFNVAVYDGFRLFLFLIPYFLLIPAITFYYLTTNLTKILHKLILITCSILFIFYIYIFFALAPYQYIYINSFAGKFSTMDTKFENDYWGISLKELFSQIKLNETLSEKKLIKFTVCGVLAAAVKYNLNNLKNKIYYKLVTPEESPDYVILNNRITKNLKTNSIHTCFQEYSGKNIIEVKRRNLTISAIKEISK